MSYQKQTETEIKMQKELDFISTKIQNKVFNDYCTYEDEVGNLIDEYCPVCKEVVDNTTIGVFILLGGIRNYIRAKANIVFKE